MYSSLSFLKIEILAYYLKKLTDDSLSKEFWLSKDILIV